MSMTNEGTKAPEPTPDDISPDSIDRELQQPLGFDLFAFEVEEPSPDATERIVDAMVRALAQARSEAAMRELGEEPAESSVPSGTGAGREPRRRAPPAKETPDPFRLMTPASARRASVASRHR